MVLLFWLCIFVLAISAVASVGLPTWRERANSVGFILMLIALFVLGFKLLGFPH